MAAVILLLVGPLRAEEYSRFGNPITTVTVGRARVRAEVVRTPEKLYQGLSHRGSLPEGEGMLFVLPSKEIRLFCMRGMEIPLDFLWIEEGRVAGIKAKVAADFDGVLASPVPVRYVLEVPAGFAGRHGIKVGDKVRWR
jgi:uncharacterized membrane protein (UPF0127 family)